MKKPCVALEKIHVTHCLVPRVTPARCAAAGAASTARHQQLVAAHVHGAVHNDHCGATAVFDLWRTAVNLHRWESSIMVGRSWWR